MGDMVVDECRARVGTRKSRIGSHVGNDHDLRIRRALGNALFAHS